MTAKTKVAKAENKAHVLDAETRQLLASVKSKNSKAIWWFVASWTVLFILAIFGIFRQNELAAQNKSHIDCIIKDLSTPQKPGTSHKYIDIRTSLTADCQIKFTP